MAGVDENLEGLSNADLIAKAEEAQERADPFAELALFDELLERFTLAAEELDELSRELFRSQALLEQCEDDKRK